VKESRNHTGRAEHLRGFIRKLDKKADLAFANGDYDTFSVLDKEYWTLYKELKRIGGEPI